MKCFLSLLRCVKKASSCNRTKPESSLTTCYIIRFRFGSPAFHSTRPCARKKTEVIWLPVTEECRLTLLARLSWDCLRWFQLLGSDFPRLSTGTGLSPSPARFDFPNAATVFVMAFFGCYYHIACFGKCQYFHLFLLRFRLKIGILITESTIVRHLGERGFLT